MNTAMPAMKVRRRPRRSPARAPSSRSAAERQGVGVEDPGQAGAGEAQRLLHLGQRDVHDRGVEDDHELGGEDDAQHEAGVADATRGTNVGALSSARGASAVPEDMKRLISGVQ